MSTIPLLLAALAGAALPEDTKRRAQELRGRLGLLQGKAHDRTGLLGATDRIFRQYGEGTYHLTQVLLHRGGAPPLTEEPTPAWERIVPWLARLAHQGLREVPDLTAVVDWSGAERVDLLPLSMAYAQRQAARWHPAAPADGDLWRRWTENVRREMRTSPTGRMLPGSVALEGEKGLRMEELTTKAELEQEGRVMGHCVGRFPQYLQGIQQGVGRILSVRNEKGWPLTTVELRKSGEHGWTIGQERAPYNGTPPPVVQPILELLHQSLADEAERKLQQARKEETPAQKAARAGTLVQAWPDGATLVRLSTLDELTAEARIAPTSLARQMSTSSTLRMPGQTPRFMESLRNAAGFPVVHLQDHTMATAMYNETFDFVSPGPLGPEDAEHAVEVLLKKPWMHRKFPGCVNPDHVSEDGRRILSLFRRGTEAFDLLLKKPLMIYAWALHIEQEPANDTRAESVRQAAIEDAQKAAQRAYSYASRLDQKATPTTLDAVLVDPGTAGQYAATFPVVLQDHRILALLGTMPFSSSFCYLWKSPETTAAVRVLANLPATRADLLKNPTLATRIAIEIDQEPRPDTLAAVLPMHALESKGWQVPAVNYWLAFHAHPAIEHAPILRVAIGQMPFALHRDGILYARVFEKYTGPAEDAVIQLLRIVRSLYEGMKSLLTPEERRRFETWIARRGREEEAGPDRSGLPEDLRAILEEGYPGILSGESAGTWAIGGDGWTRLEKKGLPGVVYLPLFGEGSTSYGSGLKILPLLDARMRPWVLDREGLQGFTPSRLQAWYEELPARRKTSLLARSQEAYPEAAARFATNGRAAEMLSVLWMGASPLDVYDLFPGRAAVEVSPNSMAVAGVVPWEVQGTMGWMVVLVANRPDGVLNTIPRKAFRSLLVDTRRTPGTPEGRIPRPAAQGW